MTNKDDGPLVVGLLRNRDSRRLLDLVHVLRGAPFSFMVFWHVHETVRADVEERRLNAR